MRIEASPVCVFVQRKAEKLLLFSMSKQDLLDRHFRKTLVSCGFHAVRNPSSLYDLNIMRTWRGAWLCEASGVMNHIGVIGTLPQKEWLNINQKSNINKINQTNFSFISYKRKLSNPPTMEKVLLIMNWILFFQKKGVAKLALAPDQPAIISPHIGRHLNCRRADTSGNVCKSLLQTKGSNAAHCTVNGKETMSLKEACFFVILCVVCYPIFSILLTPITSRKIKPTPGALLRGQGGGISIDVDPVSFLPSSLCSI